MKVGMYLMIGVLRKAARVAARSPTQLSIKRVHCPIPPFRSCFSDQLVADAPSGSVQVWLIRRISTNGFG